MAEIVPVRGRVYWANLGSGRKPWLVVSNNRRNRNLRDCLVVRVTTSVKPDLTSIVELGPDDPLTGRVLCDDVGPMYRDDILGEAGAVSRVTMERVAAGVRFAMDL
ncbi:type II toxin-antitoxin system PemK/MazF family toxin [Streptomyces sp. NPDC090085]|uniref:type II toxin-antitoxin system PemK/MazF family toxin n=1 Tax=Streptomyces sp. NPDC090085 TaxID=3365943 RepID=UPI00380ED308